MSDPDAVTPTKKQDMLDLIFEGINELKARFDVVEERTDSALNLAFQAHEKAKTALWAKTTLAPFVVSAIAAGLALIAVGVAWAR